jgi:hypothetical protein
MSRQFHCLCIVPELQSYDKKHLTVESVPSQDFFPSPEA